MSDTLIIVKKELKKKDNRLEEIKICREESKHGKKFYDSCYFSHTFAIVFFFVVIEAKVLSKESKVNIILI